MRAARRTLREVPTPCRAEWSKPDPPLVTRPPGMYSHCLFCHADLGRNQELEHFPVGRRLAFDPAKGRLWVVCPQCGRWNLSALEERWEAVEECERRFRGTLVRTSTENIGLARLPDATELVRIGAPLRPEFAAWRYGSRFARRYRRALLLGGTGLAAGTALVVGAPLVAAFTAVGLWPFVLTRYLMHEPVLEGATVARIPLASGAVLNVRAAHAERARLRIPERNSAEWHLLLAHTGGDAELSGGDAVRALALLLPRANRAGGSRGEVRRAVERIEQAGGPAGFFPDAERQARRMGLGHNPLPTMPGEVRLALEMAAHEEAERRAWAGELALLEAAWREAEQIAAIADRLAVSPAVERGVERLRRDAEAGPDKETRSSQAER